MQHDTPAFGPLDLSHTRGSQKANKNSLCPSHHLGHPGEGHHSLLQLSYHPLPHPSLPSYKDPQSPSRIGKTFPGTEYIRVVMETLPKDNLLITLQQNQSGSTVSQCYIAPIRQRSLQYFLTIIFVQIPVLEEIQAALPSAEALIITVSH